MNKNCKFCGTDTVKNGICQNPNHVQNTHDYEMQEKKKAIIYK